MSEIIQSFMPSIPPRALYQRAIPATELLEKLSDPIIDGVIPGGPTLVTGSATHTVMSAFAMDIACTIATGDSWCGRRVPQRKVIYVSTLTTAHMIPTIRAWGELPISLGQCTALQGGGEGHP